MARIHGAHGIVIEGQVQPAIWLVRPVVLRAAAAVRAGHAVVRAGLRVDPAGITGPTGQITPWQLIDRVEIDPGRVRLHPGGSRQRVTHALADPAGSQVLCLLLRELGIRASFDA